MGNLPVEGDRVWEGTEIFQPQGMSKRDVLQCVGFKYDLTAVALKA